MSDQKKNGPEVAKDEYERWCKAWKIGRKRKRMKGEDLEQAEVQEDIICGLIEDGLLTMDDKAVLHYTLEEPKPEKGLPLVFEIPRPKGDMIMETDRFKEQEGTKKAYAMIGAATGYDSKVMIHLEYNTDITNLMAVIGHFLTA